MEKMQINIQTKVNSKSIRREDYNGREHWIIPSFTMPSDVVMNGGLYTGAEIDANFEKLEGKLAPLGHPMVNGKFVSASSPEGLNVGFCGAWNRNVKKVGNRISVEKWIDVEVASRSPEGQELLTRLEGLSKGEGDPIHTSVAVYLEKIAANSADGDFDWIAKIHDIDHDAILLDQPGAATPDQGVGMMVNADEAVKIKGNAGALPDSYGDKLQRLNDAARERFSQNGERHVWVPDFNDEQAVILVDGEVANIYDYRIEDGRIVFSSDGQEVERRDSWVKRLPPVINNFLKFFKMNQAVPDDSTGGDMPITQEEMADLVQKVGTAVNTEVSKLIDPLKAQITKLETNQQSLADAVTANAKAEEADKRAVVAAKFKLSKEEADELSGNALDAFYKQCDPAAPIGNHKSDDGSAAEDFSKAID